LIKKQKKICSVLVTATRANCIPLELEIYRNYADRADPATNKEALRLPVWKAARRFFFV
jgi:hypothetical protein